jgi:hypothetical protein
LFDEAASHTPTGTAAVILGRISHVNFVNNIIFGVPATDSPDETGIDFEWSEDQVTLQANFFAANAGPAVEILNIHRGDHSSDGRRARFRPPRESTLGKALLHKSISLTDEAEQVESTFHCDF